MMINTSTTQKKIPIEWQILIVVFSIFFIWSFPMFLLSKKKIQQNLKKRLEKPWFQRSSVQSLLELSIREPIRRRLAFQEFFRRGKKSEDQLVKVLRNKKNSPRIKLEAILALSYVQSDLLEMVALEQVTSSYLPLCHTAIQKLGQCGGKKTVESLAKLLDNKKYSPWTRAFMLQSIKAITEGKTFLFGRISPQNLQVEILLWKVWWKENKNKLPVDWYLGMFQKKDSRIHVKAIELLGKWGISNKHLSKVWQILIKKGLSSPYSSVQICTMKWMNILNPKKAEPFLLQKTLSSSKGEVCQYGLLYLQKYYILGENRRKKQWIFRSFSLLDPAFKKLSSSSDWKVRKTVMKVLGSKSFQKGIPILLKGLKDIHKEVRYASSWSLQKLGRKDGIPFILEELKNPKDQRRAIVFLRSLFKKSFGLSSRTNAFQLAGIAKEWENYIKNK